METSGRKYNPQHDAKRHIRIRDRVPQEKRLGDDDASPEGRPRRDDAPVATNQAAAPTPHSRTSRATSGRGCPERPSHTRRECHTVRAIRGPASGATRGNNAPYPSSKASAPPNGRTRRSDARVARERSVAQIIHDATIRATSGRDCPDHDPIPAPDARGPQCHTATRHDLEPPGGPAPPHEAGRPASLGVARYEGRLWSYSTGPPCCGLRILARQRPYPSTSHAKDTLQPGQGAVGAEAVIGGIHVGVGEVLAHRDALGDGVILTGT